MHRIRNHVAVVFILTVLLALLVVLVACNGSDDSSNDQDQAPATREPSTPEDSDTSDSVNQGQRLVEVKCSMCHSLDRVWAAEKTREQWVVTVDRMKGNGLVVTDEEYDIIIDHLVSVAEK